MLTGPNKSWANWYFGDGIKPTLKTDDDKITDCNRIKANHDDNFDGRSLDPGDTVTQRLILQVPTDADLKTLTLVNDMGDNGVSPQFVYDLSNVK